MPWLAGWPTAASLGTSLGAGAANEITTAAIALDEQNEGYEAERRRYQRQMREKEEDSKRRKTGGAPRQRQQRLRHGTCASAWRAACSLTGVARRRPQAHWRRRRWALGLVRLVPSRRWWWGAASRAWGRSGTPTLRAR